MSQQDRDERFLAMAGAEAALSPDPSTKCGAVIVNRWGEVQGEGHNAFPDDCLQLTELYANRALKYERVVHAEVNAVLKAGHKADGGTLYSWPPGIGPSCSRCAAVMIQAGIRRVVYKHDESGQHNERWAESIAIGRRMFEEAGVEVVAL